MPITTSRATGRLRFAMRSSIAGSMTAGSPTISSRQRRKRSRIATVPPSSTESTSTVCRRAVHQRGFTVVGGSVGAHVVVEPAAVGRPAVGPAEHEAREERPGEDEPADRDGQCHGTPAAVTAAELHLPSGAFIGCARWFGHCSARMGRSTIAGSRSRQQSPGRLSR